MGMLPDLTPHELNIVCRALSLFQANVKGADSELARKLYYQLSNYCGEQKLPVSMKLSDQNFIEPPP